MSHTPGPWAVLSGQNRRGQKQPPRIALAGRAGIIATIGYPPEGDREANARLIAAAPELLGANREALEFFVARDLEPGDEEAQRVAAVLRAAIAKAVTP